MLFSTCSHFSSSFPIKQCGLLRSRRGSYNCSRTYAYSFSDNKSTLTKFTFPFFKQCHCLVSKKYAVHHVALAGSCCNDLKVRRREDRKNRDQDAEWFSFIFFSPWKRDGKKRRKQLKSVLFKQRRKERAYIISTSTYLSTRGVNVNKRNVTTHSYS